jgi:hypothetical protein
MPCDSERAGVSPFGDSSLAPGRLPRRRFARAELRHSSVAFRDLRHGVVVGGDYAKEQEAVENVAITSDGG